MIAVLFMYDRNTGKTCTDVFEGVENGRDPAQRAELMKAAAGDDFPGALWALSVDDEAREAMADRRMRAMFGENYQEMTTS
jgi:hypothetical protein